MAKIFESITKRLDKTVEDNARKSARRHGRRSALAKMGGVMAGAFAVKALPFDRAWGATPSSNGMGSSINAATIPNTTAHMAILLRLCWCERDACAPPFRGQSPRIRSFTAFASPAILIANT